MAAERIQWSTINREVSPEWIRKDRVPIDDMEEALEDAAVAAVTRLQEDLPAVTMIPEPTAAVDSSMEGLQPVEEPPEGYSRSRSGCRSLHGDPDRFERFHLPIL